jgi:hypothetical protein
VGFSVPFDNLPLVHYALESEAKKTSRTTIANNKRRVPYVWAEQISYRVGRTQSFIFFCILFALAREISYSETFNCI